MNLIRLIAIAVVFWLLYRLILTVLNKTKGHGKPRRAPQQGERMVRCEQCGMHVPRSEALEQGGKYYCCEEHRDEADSWKRDE